MSPTTLADQLIEVLLEARVERIYGVADDAHRTGAMIKLEMMVDGLPDYQTDNGRFDYAAIAQAIGIRSIRLEQPVDVRDGLGEALGDPGPVLVDLVTDSNALSIPPHITAAQVRNIPRPTIAR